MQVVNLKKKELNKIGYNNVQEWLLSPNHVYIGRNLNFPTAGVVTPNSVWRNPFKVKKYGRDECLKLYAKYILDGELYNKLNDLDGKILGCWCHPEPCHGTHFLYEIV